MEEYPPPYEMATARDAWAIIAPYIPSADLCAASLVSKKWHQMFVPFLWGAPASHFGSDNDAMYVALTRFRRTLKISRLWVRCLTHTFHLPPAITEIYGGPRSTWLLELLEHLPNLQSLLVSELPFFDHSALTALRTGRPDQGHYELRLLLAQREPNTTSLGLAQALLYFPRLVYLDLSYTTPARDMSVLSMLSQLLDLQVLKLRAIGLRDPEAEVLANAIGTRVRLLDLRDNFLTDTALRSLLQACFLPPDSNRNETVQNYLNARYEWSLSAVPSANILSEDSLRSEHLDEHLLAQLTRPLTGRAAFEDLPHVGVTHLYVADNNISVEGLMSLLKTSKLHILDGGTVDTGESIKIRNRTNTSVGEEKNFITTVRFPGAEKLIPALGKDAAERLTYLRVHHAVVTEDAPVRDNLSMNALMPELPAESLSTELETLIHQTPELDAVNNQRYEMPGSEVPIFELADTSVPTIRNRREPKQDVPDKRGRRDAQDEGILRNREEAQAVANSGEPQHGQTPVLGFPVDAALPEAIPSPIHPPSPSQIRADKIQQLIARRPKNSMLPHLNVENADFPYLHPSHIPHLRTLVLTDVPSSVPNSSPILKALIRFLTACADEALLASLQARSDYSLPPGWARANAELKHAKSLFSLERIILEVTPVRKSEVQDGPRAWIHQVHGESKSSTGDIDSENLWAAAANDFSFFGDEECGVPDNDPDRHFPMSALNEKILLVPEDDESAHSPSRSELEASEPGYGVSHHRSGMIGAEGRQGRSVTIACSSAPQPPTPQPEPDIDLVQALASFRRSKKYEYEAMLRAERQQRASDAEGRLVSPLHPSASSPSLASPIAGYTCASGIPVHVEGHWKGEVQVVRNPTPGGKTGVVDIYGNYFEKGYLYP